MDSFARLIELPDGKFMLMAVGNKDQISDLKNVVAHHAKAGPDGRSGQYLQFLKSIVSAIKV